MRVLLIYHSRSGVTHSLMKAIGAELEARNHLTTHAAGSRASPVDPGSLLGGSQTEGR